MKSEIRRVVKLTYCSHILELITDNVQEGDPSESILQLLLNTFYVIARNNQSIELITRVFELRFMLCFGYELHVISCMNCDKTDTDKMYFDLDNSGLVCSECVQPKREE